VWRGRPRPRIFLDLVLTLQIENLVHLLAIVAGELPVFGVMVGIDQRLESD
jgi:hypothetical protein